MKYEEGRHQLKVGEYGVSRGVATCELLVDVELLIHIVPDSYEEVETIYTSLKYPWEYPSLGRREDLASFDEVKIVDIEEKIIPKSDYLVPEYGAYIPVSYLSNDSIEMTNYEGIEYTGTRYLLNKNYSLVNYGTKKSPKIFRKWERVEVLYGRNVMMKRKRSFLQDEDNYFVFLA